MKNIQNDCKKRILVLASTFPRWKDDSTPPFIFELEKRLTNFFRIHVLVPHHKGAKKYEVLEKLKIFRFQYFWPAYFQKLCYEGGILPNLKRNKLLVVQAVGFIFFELLAAIRIIKKEKINFIHAHWIIPQGLVALIIKKIFGVPYIVTTHGGDIYGLKGKALSRLKKAVLENAQNISVVSNPIKDEILSKIDPNLNVSVISMGVDSKTFSPDKFDKKIREKYSLNGPLLLFVGRLAEKKGVKYLIKALPKVVKKLPSTKLLIIGEGTMENDLKKLTTTLNLEKNIVFLGPLPNLELAKYYASADILIAPFVKAADGDTEGLPVVILEALSSGTNIITTGVGGIVDVIKHQDNGILVEEKDTQNLEQAILSLIENKDRKLKIKKASLATSKQFEWKGIAARYAKLLQAA